MISPTIRLANQQQGLPDLRFLSINNEYSSGLTPTLTDEPSQGRLLYNNERLNSESRIPKTRSALRLAWGFLIHYYRLARRLDNPASTTRN